MRGMSGGDNGNVKERDDGSVKGNKVEGDGQGNEEDEAEESMSR